MVVSVGVSCGYTDHYQGRGHSIRPTATVINRVATAQGKQGIWFLLFPDRENTGNFALTQGKILRHRENIFSVTQGKI